MRIGGVRGVRNVQDGCEKDKDDTDYTVSHLSNWTGRVDSTDTAGLTMTM